MPDEIPQEDIERACKIFTKIFPTDEAREFLDSLIPRMQGRIIYVGPPDDLVIAEARARKLNEDGGV